MQPRQIRETSRPVEPSFTYCIVAAPDVERGPKWSVRLRASASSRLDQIQRPFPSELLALGALVGVSEAHPHPPQPDQAVLVGGGAGEVVGDTGHIGGRDGPG